MGSTEVTQQETIWPRKLDHLELFKEGLGENDIHLDHGMLIKKGHARNKSVNVLCVPKTMVGMESYLAKLDEMEKVDMAYCLTPIIDATEDASYWYIAFPHFQCSLECFMERTSARGNSVLSRTLDAIISSLYYLHYANVVHGNLSPKEIAISYDNWYDWVGVSIGYFMTGKKFESATQVACTKQDDIDALADIILFCINSDRKWKGDQVSADSMEGLSLLAEDLIRLMRDRRNPISLLEISNHPFFWEGCFFTSYLRAVNDLWKEHEEDLQRKGKGEKNIFETVLGAADLDLIQKSVPILLEHGRHLKYKSETLEDFIKGVCGKYDRKIRTDTASTEQRPSSVLEPWKTQLESTILRIWHALRNYQHEGMMYRFYWPAEK